MNSINSQRRFSYKDLLYKCLIFVVTVSIISYFMPKEGKFNYEFDIDKPWKYGLLQASFDFNIYKSEQQIEKERDSLLTFVDWKIERGLQKSVFPRCIQFEIVIELSFFRHEIRNNGNRYDENEAFV